MAHEDVGEPPADSEWGMPAPQSKRAQETAILEMAFDLAQFEVVEPGNGLTSRCGARPASPPSASR